MRNKISIKNLLNLQAVFFVYSIISVIGKMASEKEFFSLEFMILYGLEVVILGIYAVLWQQVIKKFELSVAFANKAVTLLWALVWGVILFKEQITLSKIVGILLVMAGIFILNSEKEVTE